MKPFIVFLCDKDPCYKDLLDPYIAVIFNTSDFSIAKVASTSMSPAEVVAYYDTPAVWSTLAQIKAVIGTGFIYMETETTGVSIEPGNRMCYYYDNTGENNVYKVNMGAEMFSLLVNEDTKNEA